MRRRRPAGGDQEQGAEVPAVNGRVRVIVGVLSSCCCAVAGPRSLALPAVRVGLPPGKPHSCRRGTTSAANQA